MFFFCLVGKTVFSYYARNERPLASSLFIYTEVFKVKMIRVVQNIAQKVKKSLIKSNNSKSFLQELLCKQSIRYHC